MSELFRTPVSILAWHVDREMKTTLLIEDAEQRHDVIAKSQARKAFIGKMMERLREAGYPANSSWLSAQAVNAFNTIRFPGTPKQCIYSE